MLRNSFVAVSVAVLLTALTAAPSPADDARKAAVQRKRKILFNNDGDDAWGSGHAARLPLRAHGPRWRLRGGQHLLLHHSELQLFHA